MAHVLIVDDLEEIRHVLRIALESCGHTVCEAADGREALEVLDAEVVQLLITDIIMPDMDGVELILHSRKLYPTMKVIAISGGGVYVRQSDAWAIVEKMGVDALIQKPLSIHEILEVVSQLLK